VECGSVDVQLVSGVLQEALGEDAMEDVFHGDDVHLHAAGERKGEGEREKGREREREGERGEES
jgi:hypothetical protein